MKNGLKVAGKLVLLTLAAAIVGYLLMVLVYCLPIGKIKEHVAAFNTYAVMDTERNYPHLISCHDDTRLDNYTDAIMLMMAQTDIGKNPFYQAAASTRDMVNDGFANAEDVMCMYLGEEITHTETYARYWHGYMIYLKPLLVFLSYDEIRYVITGIVIGLICAVLYFMGKIGQKRAIMPYIMAMLYLQIPTVCNSLQFLSCFLVINIAILVDLIWHDKFEDKSKWVYLFLFAGIATSYLDLLTYPAACFALPFAMMIMMHEDKLLNNIKALVINGITWCFGYVVFWACKWVITQVITGEATIARSIQEVLFRTSDVGYSDKLSYAEVLVATTNVAVVSYRLAVAVAIISLIYFLIRRYKIDWQNMVMMLILAVIPFAWYYLVMNHSWLHTYMTYRELSIFIFAIVGMGFSFKKRSN